MNFSVSVLSSPGRQNSREACPCKACPRESGEQGAGIQLFNQKISDQIGINEGFKFLRTEQKQDCLHSSLADTPLVVRRKRYLQEGSFKVILLKIGTGTKTKLKWYIYLNKTVIKAL